MLLRILVSCALLLCVGAFGTVLEKHLAEAPALAAELSALSNVHGCEVGDASDTICQDIRERRLTAELVANASMGRRLSMADRIKVVQSMQTKCLNNWRCDQDGAEVIRNLVSWAEGKVIPDDYFYGDEEQDPPTRRLETWKGPQLADGAPWPDRTMVYMWAPDIDDDAKKVHQSAMKEIQERTCIQFREVPYDETKKGVVKYTSDKSGCFASVGYYAHHQRSNNLAWGCRWHGIALHEILHSLGATHEQCRADRNFFVDIDMGVVTEGKEHNFRLSDKAYTSLGYDYSSIMHYDRYAFSTGFLSGDMVLKWINNGLASIGIDSGKPTIKAKNSAFKTKLGQRSRLSKNDLEQLLHMYQCPKIAPSSDEGLGLGLSAGWSTPGQYFIAADVACNPGFVSTSCTCFHKAGGCRGALFSEATGGTCYASAQQGSADGLVAQAICHKMISPHYMVARMSKEGSVGSAIITCGESYTMLGCNCLTHKGDNCDAVPSIDSFGSSCKATSSNTVYGQAVCVRAPAIERVELVTGAEGKVSEATCGSGLHLTGCSCAGVERKKGLCAGARPTGTDSNTCQAESKSDKTVVAFALCANFHSKADVTLPVVEFFSDGEVKAAADLTVPAPVQTVYCADSCKTLSIQTRTKAVYDCKQDTSANRCKTVSMTLSQEKTVVIKVESGDGQARCPPGYAAAAVTCESGDCKHPSVKCMAPPLGASWFLSGGISKTAWFSGKTASPMGTCGEALVIGIECGDATFFTSKTCTSMRLLCRQVAVVASDEEERHGTFDIRLLEATWSNWISSTDIAEKVTTLDFKDDTELKNPTSHPIQKVKCTGDNCDDLKFYLPKKFGTFSQSVDLKGTPTIWTEKFGEAEMKCPPGHYVASIRCSESFCGKKEMLCAVPQGDTWLVTGEPYYSHCFTNKAKNSWAEWWRGMKEWVRGRSRTCVGTAAENMPDTQSCGEDGVVVGFRCYGKRCAILQLLCATVDANIALETGTVLSASKMQIMMTEHALFDNAQAWDDAPKNGQPAMDSTWTGSKALPTTCTTEGCKDKLATSALGMVVADGATRICTPLILILWSAIALL